MLWRGYVLSDKLNINPCFFTEPKSLSQVLMINRSLPAMQPLTAAVQRGRDMHFLQHHRTTKVTSWVTNYEYWMKGNEHQNQTQNLFALCLAANSPYTVVCTFNSYIYCMVSHLLRFNSQLLMASFHMIISGFITASG